MKKTFRKPGLSTKVVKQLSFDQAIKAFPYHCSVETSKFEVREWFKKQSISTYQISGEPADVIWNKQLTDFYFKDEKHLVQFMLRFK